jgi:transcriptional regulator GlxA family with amidase domain
VTRRIAIVVFPEAQPLDVAGPFDVFAGANQISPGAYTVELVGPTAGRIVAAGGLTFVAQRALADVPRDVDTLIVAGGAGARRAADDKALVRAVARFARRARRVASVCTGAFVLGAAGLLDDRRATTHWAYCAALARRYPAVRVDADPIFVRDGQVWTSAGVTAGIDLALALVEYDLGRDIALTLARNLVMFVRRAGGQSQFSAVLSTQEATREPIRDLQTWIAENPGADLGVPELARRMGMSVRHFARVFRAEVGVAPAAYVDRVRADAARRLLEQTSLPVDRVAVAAGFGTAESLRRSLARHLGLSPREYRARFGARPSSMEAQP